MISSGAEPKRSGSRPSTSTPVTPSWTTSINPPTALATTGMPQAAAFEGHEAEALAPTGHDDDIGGAVIARQQVVRLGFDEHDTIGEAEIGGQSADRLLFEESVRAAGATDDDEHGVRAVHRSEGPDGDVGAFERLDPADIQHDRAVGRQADGAPRAAACPGAKKACSTAGGTVSMTPLGSPYKRRNCRSSSGQLTQMASLHPMTSASARSRQSGSRSPPSALTRARVWKVETRARRSDASSGARRRRSASSCRGSRRPHRWPRGARRRRRQTRRPARRALPWEGRTHRLGRVPRSARARRATRRASQDDRRAV